MRPARTSRRAASARGLSPRCRRRARPNRYVEDNAPWKLAQGRPRALRDGAVHGDRGDQRDQDGVLSIPAVHLRDGCTVTWGTTGPVQAAGWQLTVPEADTRWLKSQPLFKKLDPEIIEAEEAKLGHLDARRFALPPAGPEVQARHAGVIARRARAGVTAMVTIGYDMASSRRAIEIADEHEDVYAAIGVHPHDAKHVTQRDLDELERMADTAKVVAIGEIGLDFYRDLSPRDVQERVFRDQLELARNLKLPVVIHSRDAEEESYAILAEYERQALPGWPKDRPLGVMHCYAGDLPLALRYINMGFVISISATVTYPAAERTRAVAGGIPLRWMAVETDAPYLPPQTIRGERNEPARVRDVAEYVAKLRGEDVDHVCDETALTTARLFGLGDIGG